MQRSIWLRRTALAAVLALAATACGGDTGGDDETETDTETETSTATETETSTEAATDVPQNEADGTLDLGYILPESGQLAFLGPPMIEAAQLAVDLMNEAGGVLGNDVTLASGDEAGDATVASQSATRLLGDGVDAILGAAASGMSLAIIDQVTGAGVVQCSPSNTAPTFTDYEDDGLYFRTAPSDALQGPVLADVIVNAGYANVGLVARADDYGQGLLEATTTALEEQNVEVAVSQTYDPEAPDFSSEVQALQDSGAEAFAVLSFEEGAQIISGLLEGGVTPDQIFGADGVASGDLWEAVDPNDESVLEGMRGTRPGGEAAQEFLDLFAETGVEDTTFAPEMYDCANLVGLAAIAADSDAGSDIAAEMVNVATEGTECGDFADCKELLENGEDIDYNGASGPIELDEDGNITTATYEVWEMGADGSLSTVSTETVEADS